MLEDYFTTSFTIKRATITNIGGIANKTYATVTTVKGAIRQLTGGEVLENEKKGHNTTHRIYLTYSSARFLDLLVAGTDEYEVKNINNPMELNKFYQLDCEKK